MNSEPSPVVSDQPSSAIPALSCLDVVLTALTDVKAKNVIQFDTASNSDICDTMIIASGTSTRHVKALADNVVEDAKKAGFPPIGVEGERDAEWILIDLDHIIVHVMLPTTREFYDLESLWQSQEQPKNTHLA